MEMDRQSKVIPQGTLLGGCYKVEDLLGVGFFGSVLKCRDIKTNAVKAIKINRSEDRVFVQQARNEIAILERLRSLNSDTCNIVSSSGYFFHKENICIAFELLEENLWYYTANRYPRGFPMQKLRSVIHQLTTALLHLKSIGIVHADLKPDNIMIEDRKRKKLKVKLIDFGMAFTDKPGKIVQTDWYRAPEVIIDAPFNEAIDMWSLGVIIAELATGHKLYPGNSEIDVLKFIIETQGQPPDHIIDKGKRCPPVFSKQSNSQNLWGFRTEEEFAHEMGYIFEDTRTMNLKSLDELQSFMLPGRKHKVDQLHLVDLIKNMLHLDPEKRIKPEMVLQHPFMAHCLPQNCDVNSRVQGDIEEHRQTPTVRQQSSYRLKTQIDDIQPIRKISGTTHDSIMRPSVTETKPKKTGRIRRILRRIFHRANNSFPDEDTKPNIPKGTLLGGCYKVKDFIGNGGFGFIFKCRNIETKGIEAIKLNRSNHPVVVQQARHEITILERLRCLNPDTSNIIRYNGHFLHNDNICIAFELLDQDLWGYAADRYPRGFPMEKLRPVIHQLTTALLHLKSIGIVHADLKPDNIMIEDRKRKPLKVKLIDFGLAFTDKPGKIVQTDWYRAPEVIIDAPLNEAIDMWSLGVTVAELATGHTLYPGNNEEDVLKFIIETQGQPPDHVIDKGKRCPSVFSKQSNSQNRWRFKTEKEFAHEMGYIFEDTRTMNLKSLDELQLFMLPDHKHKVDQLHLVDLIKNMLHLDPEKRIKPEMVLQHPFMAHCLPQNCDVNSRVQGDIEEHRQTPTVRQQSSYRHIAQEGDIQPIRKISGTTNDSNMSPSVTETKSKKKGWIRRILRRNSDTAHNSLPDQHIQPKEAQQQEFCAQVATQNNLVISSLDSDCKEHEQTPNMSPSITETKPKKKGWIRRILRRIFHRANNSFPDEDAKPNIPKGTLLGGCYEVKDFIGKGGFGFVFKCRNIETKGIEAIKLNRGNHPVVVQQARHEITILERLRCLNPDTSNIIRYNGHFLHNDNICIAFELLDQDLWGYAADRYPRGFPMEKLRPVIHQLTTALLHLKSIGIVHADLKPGNIMIEDRKGKPLKVKLIDFGLAFTDKPGKIVQTVWYRAPEVIIDAPFNEAIDMWSLGVTVARLATGRTLYPGKYEKDVLKFIIETQGQPPDHVIDKGKRCPPVFSKQSNSQNRWRFKTDAEFAHEMGYIFKDTRTMNLRSLDELQLFMLPDHKHKVDQLHLVDLIKNMLHLDPEKRIKPEMVLQHPFMAHYLPQNCDVNSRVQGDIEEHRQTPTVRQQSSYRLKTQIDDIQPIRKISGTAHDSIMRPSVTETKPKKKGWIRRILRRIFHRANNSFPDEDTKPNIPIGTLLGGCYKVNDFIGNGGFGFIFKCRNIETKGIEAIKLNRSNHPMVVQQARHEITILERLRCLNPDTSNIIRYNGHFLHNDNICIAFELLDQDLWDYAADRYPRGFPMEKLRPVIHQLTTALLHLKSIGIVHADLKLDNIMIEDRKRKPLKVKLIDFGLAFTDKPGEIVQTDWYRAPEVIIDAPFNEAIDMWSLGVTVAELATGHTLYPGNNEEDVFKFIIETQGQPPDHVIDKGKRCPSVFSKQSNSQNRWRFKTEKEFAHEMGYIFEDTRTMNLKSLDELQLFMLPDHKHKVDQLHLVDLIKNMLHLDPEKRIKPEMVLQHPFMAHYLPQNCDVNSRVQGDIEEHRQTPTVRQQSSYRHIAQEGDIQPIRKISGTTHDSNMSPSVTETRSKKKGWIRRISRRNSDTAHNSLPDQHIPPKEAQQQEFCAQVATQNNLVISSLDSDCKEHEQTPNMSPSITETKPKKKGWIRHILRRNSDASYNSLPDQHIQLKEAQQQEFCAHVHSQNMLAIPSIDSDYECESNMSSSVTETKPKKMGWIRRILRRI